MGDGMWAVRVQGLRGYQLTAVADYPAGVRLKAEHDIQDWRNHQAHPAACVVSAMAEVVPWAGTPEEHAAALAAAPQTQAAAIREAEARTWRRAVEALRDDARYQRWWDEVQHPGNEDDRRRGRPPRGSWFSGSSRRNLADYLESLAPPAPAADALPALRALFAFWQAWQNVGTFDPGDELAATGIGSLLTIEDAHTLDAADDAVGPHVEATRRLLGLDAQDSR